MFSGENCHAIHIFNRETYITALDLRPRKIRFALFNASKIVQHDFRLAIRGLVRSGETDEIKSDFGKCD